MITKPTARNERKRGRDAARLAIACTIAAVIVTASTAFFGCARENSSVKAIRTAYESGDYDETIVQCRHAIRKEVREADVYYYYGRALLGLGRDFESYQRFAEAAEIDPAYAPRISAELIELGGDAYARGDRKRASDRLRAAVEVDDAADLGLYQYLVGDAYFADNRLAEASEFYQGALAIDPDTVLAEQAMFNLAHCLASVGDSLGAIETLEVQIETFPKGDLKDQANWKLCDLLFGNAQKQFAHGNYEDVVDQVNAMLEQSPNASLAQRARFLLGQAHERLGDYQSAYEQYRAIIDEDRGASGRIVERARGRIAAFRESGLL